jgi:ribosomal protein S27AE
MVTTQQIENLFYSETDNKYKLMLKTHWETGIHYLCITKRKNFRKYTGSGVRWKILLKSHPSPVFTCLLFSSDDIDEFNAICIEHNNLFNIPNNQNFANLVPEYGYTGNQGNLPMWWETASDIDKDITRKKITTSRKVTCLEKYGKSHVMDIARLGLLDYYIKHNVKSAMHIPEVAEKCKLSRESTMMEKYGVINNMQVPEISNRCRISREATMMEKYGVVHSLQIPGLGKKVKISREATMMEKYGVPNASLVPEIAAKRGLKISETFKNKSNVKCEFCDHESKSVLNHQNYCKYNPNKLIRQKYECPNCGGFFDKLNLNRWHLDNCKSLTKGIL